MKKSRKVLCGVLLIFLPLLFLNTVTYAQEVGVPEEESSTTLKSKGINPNESLKNDELKDISSASLANMYTMGPGDRIEIIFYEKPALEDVGRRFEATIRDDGTFYIPLLGSVVAAGYTPVELENELRKKLDRFIENPIVRVQILDYISHNAVLLGAFNNQGVFPLPHETMLTDFIAATGGLLPVADIKNIWVIRQNGDRILVDLEEYYRFGDTSQDILLVRGDKVYVPAKGEGFLVTIARVAQIAVLFLQVVTLAVVLGQ